MPNPIAHTLTVIAVLAAVTILGVTDHITGDGLLAILSGLAGVGVGSVTTAYGTSPK